MKPVLMLLTNLYNGEQEDIFLGQQLEKKFKIVMCHPADCAPLEGRVDAILIRNAWPTQSFLKVYEDMKARFLRKKLKVYNGNPLNKEGQKTGNHPSHGRKVQAMPSR